MGVSKSWEWWEDFGGESGCDSHISSNSHSSLVNYTTKNWHLTSINNYYGSSSPFIIATKSSSDNIKIASGFPFSPSAIPPILNFINQDLLIRDIPTPFFRSTVHILIGPPFFL